MSRSLRHPTHPACVCLWRNGESGRWTHQLSPGGPPTLLTQQAGTHPPFPATWPHDHPAGPTTTTWEPPDHQVPPESLKQGQELAIPTSAAVAVSAPVKTLAHAGGGETETWWVRPTTGTGTLTCANTKHLLASQAHSHHHNADSTHSGRAKAALGTIPPPGAQGALCVQVSREPRCPGAQLPRCPGSPVCGGPSKGNGSLTKNARCGLAQGLLHNCCGPKICQHVLGRSSKMYCLT